MNRLTIMIPCLGPVESCEDTLVSALQNRPADSDIVVVHTQPYADPYDLRREVQFLVVSGEPDLCALINSGLEVAGGDVVHLLSPDLLVREGWTDAALRWFEAPAIGAVSPWLITPEGRVTAAGVAYSAGGARTVVCGDAKTVDSRHHAVIGPTLRGAFYRRQALVALGGMSSHVGAELADVDIALSLRESGWKMAVEPCCRLTDNQAATSARHGYQAGVQAERLFFRHSPERDTAWAYLSHPLVAACDVLRQLPHPATITQLLGRTAAWLESGKHRDHAERIAASAKVLADAQEEVSRLRVKEPVQRKGIIPAAGLAGRRKAA